MSAYAVSSRGLAAHKLPQGVLATVMEMLYANSEKGIAKLDFSDFTGMYQDRARTVPYTAVEQPLGSFTGLNGVTATAPADVNRGVVSARVNLLTKTEQFSDAVWGKVNSVTVTQNAITVLGRTLNKIVPSAVLGYQVIRQIFNEGISGDVYITSAIFKAGEYEFGTLSDNAFSRFAVSFNLISGAVANQTGSVLSAWMEPLGDGLYRCYVKFTRGANPFYPSIGVSQFAGLAAGGPSFAGDGYSGAYSSAASTVRVTDAHLPYQRVNTPTDYDTAGFPHYLAFNGTNTTYVTPSIDFTGTDKMTVWAGVTTLGATDQMCIVELGPQSVTSPGFEVMGAVATSAKIRGQLYGTSRGVVDTPDTVFPYSTVASVQFDIGASSLLQEIKIRRDGGVVTNIPTFGSAGTGSFPNANLYIGARTGTVQFFNGRLYNLIVRGAQSSLSQIEATENLIRKTMRLP